MRAADPAVRPTCNARKKLSLQHMRLLLPRSATVHSNDSPASPRRDARTKVGNAVRALTADGRPSPTGRTSDPPHDPRPRPRAARSGPGAPDCMQRHLDQCPGAVRYHGVNTRRCTSGSLNFAQSEVPCRGARGTCLSHDRLQRPRYGDHDSDTFRDSDILVAEQCRCHVSQ